MSVQSTIDHSPEDKKERQRIEQSGGYVVYFLGTYRVNEMLAVSRALGDRDLKKRKDNGSYSSKNSPVSCSPDILKFDHTQVTDLVLATDGL
jgi:protein phosphatase 1L